MKKTLIIYSTTKMEDMLAKGNVWYTKYYETYFDKVYVVYLLGKSSEPITNGNTTLVSLGKGKGLLDLFMAPYRLYVFSNNKKNAKFLTADLVFSWWISSLIKIFLRIQIYLMPVCMPEEIYKSSGQSLSGKPIWLERLFVKLSFFSADKVYTGYSFGAFVSWLLNDKLAKKKLIITDKLVESLPSYEFYQKVEMEKNNIKNNNVFTLIYVGRLHREKLVDDLIEMMVTIKKALDNQPLVKLLLIGDGPEKQKLECLAHDLEVDQMVDFLGVIPNHNLPQYLYASDIYVSPLTGTSLREAALCGLPIIAYDMDWISGLLQHEETALLVRPGDYEEMGQQVLRLFHDGKLKKKLSVNIREFAWNMWSPNGLEESLAKIFEG